MSKYVEENISPYQPDTLKTKTFRVLNESGIIEVHRLRTLPIHYEAIVNRDKTAEIRISDRNFKIGDVIQLEEWLDTYTGRMCWVLITHILEDFEGIERGFCMLSFEHTQDPWCDIKHVQELD